MFGRDYGPFEVDVTCPAAVIATVGPAVVQAGGQFSWLCELPREMSGLPVLLSANESAHLIAANASPAHGVGFDGEAAATLKLLDSTVG